MGSLRFKSLLLLNAFEKGFKWCFLEIAVHHCCYVYPFPDRTCFSFLIDFLRSIEASTGAYAGGVSGGSGEPPFFKLIIFIAWLGMHV